MTWPNWSIARYRYTHRLHPPPGCQPGLRAWIRATQHTAAFWEHHFPDAARYADELAGPFTCSMDRAGGIWSDVCLALGQPADALIEADRAVAAFERAPTEQRNPGSERMARVQQVRAHLMLGQFDGAAEALSPVLGTAVEHRVRPLLQRLAEVRAQVMTCEQQDEPALRGLREAITDFRRQAIVAELST